MSIIRNSPIVITGPSGVGKDALIRYVESNNSEYLEAIGATTRKKRKIETGKMIFLTRKKFEYLIQTNSLIEYTIYNGNYYGVAKSEFEKLKEYHVMFNVGYSSARIIKETFNDTFMIYLLPPNKEELLRRIGDRGYERYLIGIEETMKNAFKYDYLLISQTDDLESTYADFLDIVSKTHVSQQLRLTRAKNIDFVRNFYK